MKTLTCRSRMPCGNRCRGSAGLVAHTKSSRLMDESGRIRTKGSGAARRRCVWCAELPAHADGAATVGERDRRRGLVDRIAHRLLPRLLRWIFDGRLGIGIAHGRRPPGRRIGRPPPRRRNAFPRLLPHRFACRDRTLLPARGPDAGPVRSRDLFDRSAALHALRSPRDDPAARLGLRGLVLLLHQQPVLLRAGTRTESHSNEMKCSRELLAVELELEVTFAETTERISQRCPRAAVPDEHGAAAVLALRDDSLEPAVFDGMVLDLHGEPFLGGVETRSLRDGPALQDSIHLEAKIVMEPRGGVLLHDEAQLAALRAASCGTRGLGGAAKVALSPV